MDLSKQVERLAQLPARCDVAIIGGGILGAGIARDAALRGLTVGLFEKADFGGGTTAGSTRLIHGGLRYLEMLDFRLVRMDLRERETLLRIAPHLVKPLRFVIPFYDRSLFYRARLKAGMILYDGLSYDKSLPSHRFWTSRETLLEEPQLRSEGLQGAAVYYDAQVDSPERLTIENIVDARRHGAVALNYAEVTGAVEAGERVTGVQVRDVLTGASRSIGARLVVNASGPWFDRVAGLVGPPAPHRIRTTKGVHLACHPVARNAVVLFSPHDGRLFFVIPWLGYGWLGTTDTDYDGDPADARATSDDVAYLLSSARGFFPALARRKPYWSTAGVRALVKEPGSESSVSRLHRIRMDRPGLLSLLGGKITGYRAIAEEVMDLACRELRNPRTSETAAEPLPGAAEPAGSDHLDRIYGSRAAQVRELAASHPELAARLAPEYPDMAAQVVHAVRDEHCLRVDDFMLRRSLLGFSRDRGAAAVPAVAACMARELSWTAARTAAEIERYEPYLASVPV